MEAVVRTQIELFRQNSNYLTIRTRARNRVFYLGAPHIYLLYLPYVPTYSLIPTWRKKSANQNPLLRNVEAFSPPREVCAASSFLCVISGCNQSMLTTAPFNVTLHDYNLRLRTQTVSSGEH